MKVLMFGWEFPPHITGGLGTACFGMTKGLAKHDVEVLFVVPKAYGDESQEAVRIINASDVEMTTSREIHEEYWKMITYMEVGSNLVPYLSPEQFELEMKELRRAESGERKVESGKRKAESGKRRAESGERKVRGISAFAEKYQFSGRYGANLMEEVSRYAVIAAAVAEDNEFDVIHAHDWLTYPAGIAAKAATGKPLVVHMHATEFDRSGEHVNQTVYDIERKGMEEADRVITVSDWTKNIVIERYGINPEKVITVHNAVEPPERENLQVERHVREKVVTFLGRITFQKGPEYFVEAAYKVLQKDPDVRFVMAGTGDLMHKMVHRVAQLGMGTKFHFTGFLKGENVDRMFLLSDVYVMPSISEPFGISPLEAMRSNVPVVISKQSGVSEVLKNAIKLDFWDIDAMADAIYGLLHYPVLWNYLSKNGTKEVNDLKWENAATLIRNVYESTLT